jgi:hypothetical protein
MVVPLRGDSQHRFWRDAPRRRLRGSIVVEERPTPLIRTASDLRDGVDGTARTSRPATRRHSLRMALDTEASSNDSRTRLFSGLVTLRQG